MPLSVDAGFAHDGVVNTRLGVIYRPDFHPDGLRGVATAAEAAGVDELWFWEDCFQQGGIAQVAVALASTERLSVGIGLIPAPLRNVTAAAMEFATLDAMFPGRTQIAVGHGVQSWMRQAGAAVASPLTLLREYVTALRALLAGEEVTVDGRYVRLSERPAGVPARASDFRSSSAEPGPRRCGWPARSPTGSCVDSRYSTHTVREALRHVADGPRRGRCAASVQHDAVPGLRPGRRRRATACRGGGPPGGAHRAACSAWAEPPSRSPTASRPTATRASTRSHCNRWVGWTTWPISSPPAGEVAPPS